MGSCRLRLNPYNNVFKALCQIPLLLSKNTKYSVSVSAVPTSNNYTTTYHLKFSILIQALEHTSP